MNILVTGATGFLGARLCRALEDRGNGVVRLNSTIADLRRPDSLAPYNNGRYDVIYHLAAWTQAGDFCLNHPGEQWIINQQINTHVLAWWQKNQPQAKLVTMGTSCSYPTDRELVENHYMEGTPIDSLYTYAMTKRMLYVGLQALHHQFDLNYLYLVPSTLYGPGYHPRDKQMHFIFDLIRKIVSGKRHGKPVVLWGDGHQKRELVYIDDFVAVCLALTERTANDIVNIGGGREYSIRWFAEKICKLVGYNPDLIQYDTSCYVGAKSKVLNIEKLHRLIPNLYQTSIEDGLKKTTAWFESTYAKQTD